MRGRKTMDPSLKDRQVTEEMPGSNKWSVFGLKMGFFKFGVLNLAHALLAEIKTDTCPPVIQHQTEHLPTTLKASAGWRERYLFKGGLEWQVKFGR